jgi:dihydrofolate reductase
MDKEEIFIIGGAQIYKQALPYADKLYLTIVDQEAEADTFFPDYSGFENVVKEGKGETGNGVEYKFLELTKN